MKRIVLLGAGMVGSAIAKDLSEDYDVTIVDKSEKQLDLLNDLKINKICSDCSDEI